MHYYHTNTDIDTDIDTNIDIDTDIDADTDIDTNIDTYLFFLVNGIFMSSKTRSISCITSPSDLQDVVLASNRPYSEERV